MPNNALKEQKLFTPNRKFTNFPNSELRWRSRPKGLLRTPNLINVLICPSFTKP